MFIHLASGIAKLISIVVLGIALNSYAGDRVDRPQLTLKKIASFNNATGWIQNDDGRWVSGKNTVPANLGEAYKILRSDPEYLLGEDNFRTFSFYSTVIDAKPYIFFVKTFRDGRYYYKNIRKDWLPDDSTYVYLIDPKELSKLNQLTDSKSNKITINALSFEYYQYESHESALSIIKKQVWQTKPSTDGVVFQVFPNKAKHITRFLIHPKESKYFNNKGLNPLDSEDIYSKYYYETEYEKLDKFFSQIKDFLAKSK